MAPIVRKNSRNFVTICGNGASHLNIENSISFVSDKFACGEIKIQFFESVRHAHVIIIQSFKNVNDDLMELLLLCDAAKRAGAKTLTVILPFFPYARQDRKSDSGTPISARVVCDLLKTAGINRLLAIDLHATQIQGFMSNKIQFDHVPSSAFLAYHLRKSLTTLTNISICSPDAGGVKRARKIGGLLGINEFCMIDKTREEANAVKEMQVIGNVHGKDVLILDDMIDTAGTIEKATDTLYQEGAVSVKVAATHGLFSGPAFDRLASIETYTTDSLEQSENMPENIHVFPIRNLVMHLVDRIVENGVLSDLFYIWEED